jgi:hypothetical protein
LRLDFQFEDLGVERIPPDCPDDMCLHLASLKRKAVKQWLMTTCQTRWYSSEKGRTTFSWIPRVRLAASAGWRDFSRDVTCLLTGHGRFNKRLFALGLSDTPSCACGEDEDWEHLLRDCPLYDQEGLLVKIISAYGLYTACLPLYGTLRRTPNV